MKETLQRNTNGSLSNENEIAHLNKQLAKSKAEADNYRKQTEQLSNEGHETQLRQHKYYDDLKQKM